MDKIYRHLLRLAISTLPLACLAMLASCSFEDEVGDCSGESATVRVSVSAGEIGDLNGTRAGGDTNADEHEFMHSLYVYIVDGSGNIVKRFDNPIATGYDEAATGDLVKWTSEPFELNPGTYTIYAFSNFEGHIGITDAGQAAQSAKVFITSSFDKTVDTSGLNQFRLVDPAGEIKLTGNDGETVFIPMSAKMESVQVTPTTTELSVGLVRLVSKVKLTMPAEDINNDAASVTFSNYSTNVPLFGALYSGRGDYSYNTNTTYYGDRTASTTALLSSATPDSDGNITASLYVNETNTGDPFTVTFNTGKSGNGDVSAYVAKTQRTDIPRNSIYPLSLTFPDFTPQFEWQSWEAAIGSVPVEVVVEENNYIVKIASGNTFKFTVNGVNGTNSQLQSATWAHGDVTNQITDIQIGNNAIGGAISAGVPAGTQIPLTVTVNWRADYTDATDSTETRNFTRTYNVTIETIDIWDTGYKPDTRGSWCAYRLTPEVLNMFIKR